MSLLDVEVPIFRLYELKGAPLFWMRTLAKVWNGVEPVILNQVAIEKDVARNAALFTVMDVFPKTALAVSKAVLGAPVIAPLLVSGCEPFSSLVNSLVIRDSKLHLETNPLVGTCAKSAKVAQKIEIAVSKCFFIIVFLTKMKIIYTHKCYVL